MTKCIVQYGSDADLNAVSVLVGGLSKYPAYSVSKLKTQNVEDLNGCDVVVIVGGNQANAIRNYYETTRRIIGGSSADGYLQVVHRSAAETGRSYEVYFVDGWSANDTLESAKALVAAGFSTNPITSKYSVVSFGGGQSGGAGASDANSTTTTTTTTTAIMYHRVEFSLSESAKTIPSTQMSGFLMTVHTKINNTSEPLGYHLASVVITDDRSKLILFFTEKGSQLLPLLALLPYILAALISVCITVVSYMYFENQIKKAAATISYNDYQGALLDAKANGTITDDQYNAALSTVSATNQAMTTTGSIDATLKAALPLVAIFGAVMLLKK
jgi:hypothetical protein